MCFVVAQIVHAVMPVDIECGFLVVLFRDVPGFGPKLFDAAQSGKWRERTVTHLATLKEPEIEADFSKKGFNNKRMSKMGERVFWVKSLG